MSKTIGIIAEDTSDVDVITALIGKYVDRNKFSIKKFVGNGCGKLRNKCDSWTALLFEAGCHHVLIFHDLDRNDEAKLKKLLLKKVPKEQYPNAFIVIPIEELEAWLLSDEHAIQSVFGLKAPPKKIINCEQVQSPKEHLAGLVWTLGKKRYLNTVHNKKISEKIVIENLRRCPSFKPLDDYIETTIFKLRPVKA
ncbi:MAG: DUF4276 family protein [Geobacteraceae bacterium]|nr:DUF4276 family protein [Geobacteraceae bacterium]